MYTSIASCFTINYIGIMVLKTKRKQGVVLQMYRYYQTIRTHFVCTITDISVSYVQFNVHLV